jgi:hypothetical protein
VATAVFDQQERFNQDAVARLVNARYYPQLLKAFEAKYGAIKAIYYGGKSRVAAVLTEADKVEIVTPLGTAATLEAVKLVFQAQNLANEAYLLLRPPDRQICLERIFSTVVFLLGILDARAEHEGKRDAGAGEAEMLKFAREELVSIRDFYERSAQRTAQTDYLRGMMIGVVFIALVVAVLVRFHLASPGLGIDTFVYPIIAGGIGAVVSVMSRMTFAGLTLNHYAGQFLLVLLGSFRPLIGAIFGAAFYVLLASSLLPIAGPKDAASSCTSTPGWGSLPASASGGLRTCWS